MAAQRYQLKEKNLSTRRAEHEQQQIGPKYKYQENED